MDATLDSVTRATCNIYFFFGVCVRVCACVCVRVLYVQGSSAATPVFNAHCLL